MPFALDIVRKLGRRGHRVFAADTFRTAPGSHSKYVAEAIVTVSPRHETNRYIQQLKEIIASRSIDLVVPTFEESLYIAQYLDELQAITDVFLSPFDTLERLHDKARFVALCGELGLRTPKTVTAANREELRNAVAGFDRYFARPSYSRGGLELLTNAGPRAMALSIEQCQPTPENPWIVQEYVAGDDVCSYSVAHRGQLAAHSTYVHPREIDQAGAIVFRSVDDPVTLEITQRVVKALGYTGHIHFDYMRNDSGHTLLECNPRATTGVIMLSDEAFDRALLDRNPIAPRIAQPGIERKYSAALVRDMLLNWKEAPIDLQYLLSSARDVYAERDDLVPAFYQLLSYSHVASYRREVSRPLRKGKPVVAAYFHDVLYDGHAPRRDAPARRGAPASSSR